MRISDFLLNQSFYDLILEVMHLDVSIITLALIKPHASIMM